MADIRSSFLRSDHLSRDFECVDICEYHSDEYGGMKSGAASTVLASSHSQRIFASHRIRRHREGFLAIKAIFAIQISSDINRIKLPKIICDDQKHLKSLNIKQFIVF